MNINIKKYAILLIMAMVTLSLYADYTNKQPVIKIYRSDGSYAQYFLSEIGDIRIATLEKDDNINGSIDLTVLKGELQSALTDTKNSVVATSAHGYQYCNANSVDVFAGYMTVSRSDFQYGPALNNTYQWPNGYYGSACLAGPVEALYNTYTYAESLHVPEYKAIAQIVYGITALRAVNNAGCLPYHDLRNLKVSRPFTYLTQEEIYNEILKDLDEAIATLKIVQPDKEALMAVEGDAYDQGNATFAFSEYRWQKWVQLANTIKLRIAMYLAKPNEALAKQIATEALADEIGVLDEDFGPAWKAGYTQHPLYTISASKDGGWADIRMSASIENILKRTGSPLIAKFFTKNIDKISGIGTGADKGKGAKKEADYYGIRQGTNVGIKTTGQGYYNFSEVSVAFKYVRQVWVSKEEVIFLKAEYALRWGEDADAKKLYEQGIRSALAKYELAGEADKYLAQTAVVQKKVAGKVYDIDYIDPYNNKNSLP
ncbi:MAG: SusD/RagB family nutrient-binding outer membrane lipoprotein, partial [Marinifilaceae bacterium]|nr:SusD/RagB family nutrient-binding outer membrane lipoprotein [Marinifilaceae bacterium]